MTYTMRVMILSPNIPSPQNWHINLRDLPYKMRGLFQHIEGDSLKWMGNVREGNVREEESEGELAFESSLERGRDGLGK